MADHQRVRLFGAWAFTLSAFAVLAAGCTDATHGQRVAVRILDATHFEIDAGPCPAGPMKVRLKEAAAEVAVLLTYNINSDAKCTGIANATLVSRLGSRPLINANTGLPLVIIEDLRCTPKVTSKRCDGVTVGTDPG